MSRHKVPAYQLHRASGLAKVRIDGRDVYLGRFGSADSKEQYERLVHAWLLKQDPHRIALNVAELALEYLRYAKSYYVKNGQLTSEVASLRAALRPLIALHSKVPAAEYSPRLLKEVRERMIASGGARTTINQQIDRIRRMFRWGVEEERIPVAVYQALKTVPGLRRGRTVARETPPVRPVEQSIVAATLPCLPPIVADMVQLQRLCSMRPGEVCQLRLADIDRSTPVWTYRPGSHKTEHHGQDRRIYIGPRGQEILSRYLHRPEERPCFSPVESEEQRRQEVHERRRTPLKYGNRPGTNRRHQPRRIPKDHYTNCSYARAIARACEMAFGMPAHLRNLKSVEDPEERQRLRAEASAWRAENVWSPNQLRHAAATEIREKFGLEAAQASLGHQQADVTQLYAERNFNLAERIAAEIG